MRPFSLSSHRALDALLLVATDKEVILHNSNGNVVAETTEIKEREIGADDVVWNLERADEKSRGRKEKETEGEQKKAGAEQLEREEDYPYEIREGEAQHGILEEGEDGEGPFCLLSDLANEGKAEGKAQAFTSPEVWEKACGMFKGILPLQALYRVYGEAEGLEGAVQVRGGRRAGRRRKGERVSDVKEEVCAEKKRERKVLRQRKVEEKKRSRKRMHACGEGDGEGRTPAKTLSIMFTKT